MWQRVRTSWNLAAFGRLGNSGDSEIRGIGGFGRLGNSGDWEIREIVRSNLPNPPGFREVLNFRNI